MSGHGSAESLKHYIDAASTSRSVEASDVLEELINPQPSTSAALTRADALNSDLEPTQPASHVSSVLNFDLNALPTALLSGATLHNCTINFNINVNK